jgi:hypothetical protein
MLILIYNFFKINKKIVNMKKIIALMLIFIINFLSVNILNALDYNIQPVNSKKECVIANIDD